MAGRPRPRARKGARSVKIVVTGPFGAGKTTLISALSEIEVLTTERRVTDDTRVLKGQTTVAMDFGRLTIDRDLVLYLFGTPGQKRFDFMWEILAEGMLGFVVMVDAVREASYAEAADIVAFFREQARVPYVVAVTKTGGEPDAVLDAVRAKLEIPASVRVVAIDARDRESAKGALLELLYAVLESVDDATPAAVG